MLGRLIGLPLVLAVVAVTELVVLAGPSVAADKACHVENHKIVCTATDPGQPGGKIPGGGRGVRGGSATCQYEGNAMPCVKNGAPWVASHGCYGEQIPNPAAAGDPAWAGHNASEGHLWYCIAGPLAIIPQNTWFVGTGAAAAPLPDPEVLARRALSEMSLATADVHTAPGYPDNEVVGVDAWLWVPSGQWRTLSNSLTVGPTRVAVAAVPDHVSWEMGDGAMKTCYGAGRPWVVGMTDAATTDCGYTYRSISAGQPDGLFHITARITYQVDWTCRGACSTLNGSLGQVPALAGGGQIKSVQRQTVVVN